jgi:hypothetical protein
MRFKFMDRLTALAFLKSLPLLCGSAGMDRGNGHRLQPLTGLKVEFVETSAKR